MVGRSPGRDGSHGGVDDAPSVLLTCLAHPARLLSPPNTPAQRNGDDPSSAASREGIMAGRGWAFPCSSLRPRLTAPPLRHFVQCVDDFEPLGVREGRAHRERLRRLQGRRCIVRVRESSHRRIMRWRVSRSTAAAPRESRASHNSPRIEGGTGSNRVRRRPSSEGMRRNREQTRGS